MVTKKNTSADKGKVNQSPPHRLTAESAQVEQGKWIELTLSPQVDKKPAKVYWAVFPKTSDIIPEETKLEDIVGYKKLSSTLLKGGDSKYKLNTHGLSPGIYVVQAIVEPIEEDDDDVVINVEEGDRVAAEAALRDENEKIAYEYLLDVNVVGSSQSSPFIEDGGKVVLKSSTEEPTSDMVLWEVINKSTESIQYTNFAKYIDDIICRRGRQKQAFDNLLTPADFKIDKGGFMPTRIRTYKAIHRLAEQFLLDNVGVPKALDLLTANPDDLQSLSSSQLSDYIEVYFKKLKGNSEDVVLPYLDNVSQKLPDDDECDGVRNARLSDPLMLELIWSYWHEEGMLVQTLNAISLRFQNKYNTASRSQLERLSIDPLRPLSNILWGYIQGEGGRLSVVRRAYEYDHHYGLKLLGKAAGNLRSVDSRSSFLQAFHNLLRLAALYYKEYDDTTIVADAFPLRNALREVHMVLADGAYNQYGDLPWTARVEMLVMQYVLGRGEMREFLGGKIMTPYEESWMDRVDTMKKMQGWTDTSVSHFRNLAFWGERLLLSIRFGNWNSASIGAPQAANWAIFWRNDIQGYLHAYQSVTGVDLSRDVGKVDATLPGVHLMNRLKMQKATVKTGA